MANYYASARSNKFRVKDIQKFKESMHPSITVEVLDEKEGLVMIYSIDESGWPIGIYNEETHKCEEWEVTSEIESHLKDDEWCVIQEVGAENLKYLIGYSVAFNNKGEEFTVSIDDVYKHLPDDVSSCTY